MQFKYTAALIGLFTLSQTSWTIQAALTISISKTAVRSQYAAM